MMEPAPQHSPTPIERPVKVAQLLNHLPSLPSNLRYYDSVQDKHHTLKNYPEWKTLSLCIDGRTRGHDFSHFGEDTAVLFRYVIADLFSRVDAKTVSTHLGNLKNVKFSEELIVKASTLSPAEFRSWWIEQCATQLSERKCGAFKAVLRSFCRLVIGHWNSDYLKFVSGLPSPPKNRYAAIDAGTCFVPIHSQAKLTDWLDELAVETASNPLGARLKRLREACGLTLGYQLGLRPVQIASVKEDDVSMRDGRVYVRILVAKQRDKAPFHVTRRLKPEWSAFWIEFARRRPNMIPALHAHPNSFLGLPPERISREFTDAVERITGERWTPNDFRHSAAQRLADAGASHAEIQDFLMHGTDGAANAYFTGSAAQAEKINQAMGLSQVYQAVAEIARIGMIDRQTLETLPEDQQIGGAPHGIPIAGIGACRLGQSQCTKNPILSCYGCRSFLPLNDPPVHQEVANDLRNVVKEFLAVASDVDASPAFGQLRRTIEAADRVAAQATASRQVSG